MQKQADAVIIGAGVMGCSIAFHLARAGLGRVVLIDKKGVAAGNSAKSGALVRMHYTDEPQVKLALAALRYFQHWGDLVGGVEGETGFTETGFLYLVGPDNIERLRQNVAMQQQVGVNTREINLDDVRELQPGMKLDGVAAACYEPESGFADPVATTQAFARAAQGQGVELTAGVLAQKLLLKGGRVVGLETSQGTIETPLVIAAIGPWSNRLLEPVGVELPIKPHRAQIAFYERPALLDKKLTYIDLANGLYGRRAADATVLAGSSGFSLPSHQPRNLPTDQWGGPESDPDEGLDPDNYNEAADPEYVEYTRQVLVRRYPVLEGATYHRGHAGIYDMTPDTRPIMGCTAVEGLYVAAGFSGQGFKISPVVGAAMAQLITGSSTHPELDLTPFRLSRFAENDLIYGQWEYL